VAARRRPPCRRQKGELSGSATLRENLDEESFTEVSKRILESEELIRGTFLVSGEGSIAFAGPSPSLGSPAKKSDPEKCPPNWGMPGCGMRAENAELQRQKYEEAIALYQRLIAAASDQGAKAFILTRIGAAMSNPRIPKTIEAYKKALQTCPPHVTAEGIPLAVIAWSQIGMLILDWERAQAFLLAFLEFRQASWTRRC